MPQQETIFGTLASRRVITVTGGDATPFLQGLITQDVHAHLPAYAFLLTPQGRVRFDFYLHAWVGGFALDVDAAWADELCAALTKHRLRQNVAIAIAPDVHVVVDGLARSLMADTQPPPPVDADAFRTLCLSHGVFDGRADFRTDDTVADVDGGALGAVSFTKGCYMGQELTSRMHHRGGGKKQLVVTTDAAATGDLRARHGAFLVVMTAKAVQE